MLYLTEGDVEKILTMKDAIQVVEEAMKEWGGGRATNNPRARVEIGGRVLNVLSAGVQATRTFGFKAYTTLADGTRGTSFLILNYDTTTGNLEAVVQAGTITRTRTGAATAVATKYLARKDSRVLGIIGAGKIGELQVKGLMEGNGFEKVIVYDPIQESMKRLVALVRDTYSVDSIEASNSSEIAKKSDVVVTATWSEQPVIEGRDLRPGTHLNAVGSNSPKRAEVDEASFERAALVVVDHRAQCMLEAGDIIRAVAAKKVDWSEIIDLPELVAHRERYSRRDEDITIFKSVGLAIEDVAVARRVVEKALELGIGTQIPVS